MENCNRTERKQGSWYNVNCKNNFFFIDIIITWRHGIISLRVRSCVLFKYYGYLRVYARGKFHQDRGGG